MRKQFKIICLLALLLVPNVAFAYSGAGYLLEGKQFTVVGTSELNVYVTDNKVYTGNTLNASYSLEYVFDAPMDLTEVYYYKQSGTFKISFFDSNNNETVATGSSNSGSTLTGTWNNVKRVVLSAGTTTDLGLNEVDFKGTASPPPPEPPPEEEPPPDENTDPSTSDPTCSTCGQLPPDGQTDVQYLQHIIKQNDDALKYIKSMLETEKQQKNLLQKIQEYIDQVTPILTGLAIGSIGVGALLKQSTRW